MRSPRTRPVWTSEFEGNLKKLEEKLKTERAYEKWVYLVSKWTVNSVVKERAVNCWSRKRSRKRMNRNHRTRTPAVIPSFPK